MDLLNLKLPTNAFDFVVIDKDKAYDPEDAQGIYAYLEAQQPVVFEFGYELNDGSIEWIPGGTTFTTSELSVDVAAAIPKVSFKSVSTLNYLTKTYTEGLYYPSGITLYDLAEDVLQFCNIPLNAEGNSRWTLDDALKDYSTKMPLPVSEARECLQLIANAGMCVLTDDVLGNVVIAPVDYYPVDFTFTLGDVMTPPKTTKGILNCKELILT